MKKILLALSAWLFTVHGVVVGSGPLLQSQAEAFRPERPSFQSWAPTPVGGTTFAGGNFHMSLDGMVTTFPKNGGAPIRIEAPRDLKPDDFPGHRLPVRYSQGLFWASDSRCIYRYESKTRAWIKDGEAPVVFTEFAPVFDGSHLLLNTLEIAPDGTLRPRAVMEVWDGKSLQTLIPIPEKLKQNLSFHDLYEPFWDIEAHEFEENILLFGRFTGYLAVYQPTKGLKEVATPWERISFEEYFSCHSDPRYKDTIQVRRKPGGPLEPISIVASRAPYPIQFIPMTPGKVLVVYKNKVSADRPSGAAPARVSTQQKEASSASGFDSTGPRAFELDLVLLDRFPIEVAEGVAFPWWFDSNRGLISLKNALAPKEPEPVPASGASSPKGPLGPIK